MLAVLANVLGVFDMARLGAYCFYCLLTTLLSPLLLWMALPGIGWSELSSSFPRTDPNKLPIFTVNAPCRPRCRRSVTAR